MKYTTYSILPLYSSLQLIPCFSSPLLKNIERPKRLPAKAPREEKISKRHSLTVRIATKTSADTLHNHSRILYSNSQLLLNNHSVP